MSDMALKCAVSKEWKDFNADFIKGTCQTLRACLKKVVSVKGGCTKD